MFIENKFTTWYYQLIDRANNRTVDPNQYYETHHIIPRCMGGSNAKSNLVKFTAREHYIAHMLLVRMTTGSPQKKMRCAVWKMLRTNSEQQRYIPCNRQYEIIKKNMAKAISEQNKGKILAKTSNKGQVPWNKGKTGVMSADARQKISQARKASKANEETRRKISEGVKRSNINRSNINRLRTSVKGLSNPKFKYVLFNQVTKQTEETNHLRNWCKEHDINTAYIYTGRSDWKIIEKYSLKTGELIK